MLLQKMNTKAAVFIVALLFVVVLGGRGILCGESRRILLDTDVDTDDFFALLYLLKLNRSEFQVEVMKTIPVVLCFYLFVR